MHATSGVSRAFGPELRRLRGELSQRELAIRAGTSQSYLSRVELGEVIPSLSQAEHLVNCLGYALRVELEPLAGRTDRDGLPEQLTMTAEERMQSAAHLHNAMQELKAGLE